MFPIGTDTEEPMPPHEAQRPLEGKKRSTQKKQSNAASRLIVRVGVLLWTGCGDSIRVGGHNLLVVRGAELCCMLLDCTRHAHDLSTLVRRTINCFWRDR